MAKAKKSASSRSTAKARVAVLILAAGKGTRLKSKYPKVLHAIGGRPLLEHVIAAASQVAAPQDIFCIIGHEAERVRLTVAHTGVQFVLQEEQRGTGHAVMCARKALNSFEHVLVLSGDVPLIQPATLRQLMKFHLREGAAMTIMTARPANPFGYGRIVRAGGHRVAAIVEQRALKPAQAGIGEINSGIYVFNVPALLKQLSKLETNNYHHEYYLTDVAALLVKARQPVLAMEIKDAGEILGINTRAELARMDASLRQRKAEELMARGVTIFRPETCTIDPTVEAGPDTVIDPFVQLLGNTRVGSDCHIGSYSVIRDSQIGDGVEVKPSCVVNQSEVQAGAILGPFAHLRPGSEIGERAHVGNFVETKKVRLGTGAKANHLTYLGDAEVGAGVNVGAGTITCNYDGVDKHRTIIEEGAFIGSDATLVAPVRIGARSYIAAGSCITEDVPADSLGIARGRQTVKPGWARQKRELRAAQRSSQDSGQPA